MKIIFLDVIKDGGPVTAESLSAELSGVALAPLPECCFPQFIVGGSDCIYLQLVQNKEHCFAPRMCQAMGMSTYDFADSDVGQTAQLLNGMGKSGFGIET